VGLQVVNICHIEHKHVVSQFCQPIFFSWGGSLGPREFVCGDKKHIV